MAVARMKKVQILAHASVKEEVVAALRERGVLHIAEPTVSPDVAARLEPPRATLNALQARLAKLEHVRVFLKPHVEANKALETLAKPKLLLGAPEIEAILASTDADALYERAVAIEAEVRNAEAEIARREALAAELARWAGMGAPLETVTDTGLVRVRPATVAASDFGSLEEELRLAAPETAILEVSRAGACVRAVVFYLREFEAAVAPVLKKANVRWVDFGGARGTPRDAEQSLLAEAGEHAARIDRAKEDAAALAAEYPNVLVALDEAAENLARKSIEERFAGTRDAFLIEGWVRGRDEQPLAERLSRIAPAIAMATRGPEPGEDVPVDLDNKPLVAPCEFVVTMYGRPAYCEWDPTPLIAPFFILFFGLCIGDAIYGAVIALAAFLLIARLPKRSGARGPLKLLAMGGISTLVVGVLTGGWGGIAVDSLPAALRDVMLIDPLAEPMKMLNFVFLLGVIHILFGVGIKMAMDLKEGRWADALLDQLAWMILIAALAPLGFKYIFGGSVPEGVVSASRTWALVFLVIVGLTGGRKNRNPVLKVIGGIPKLYGVVNYFADVLSYARLLALGLATTAIAMAVNGVGSMASGMPFIGPVAMVFVLLAGHAFNCAINILGAFVHPARLQYLEFFGKFFTGGGRAFAPFRVERRYSTVDEAERAAVRATGGA